MTREVPPATLARLLRARDRLHDAPTEAPTVAALAAEVRLSRAHFFRSFVRAFGVTPHDYRTAVRLGAKRRREHQPPRGTSTVKIDPASTRLRTESVPPIASTSWREIHRPSPRPA